MGDVVAWLLLHQKQKTEWIFLFRQPLESYRQCLQLKVTSEHLVERILLVLKNRRVE
jgi:hypothetical protein